MLTHAPVTTMLPVIDLARARAFYEGSLGLKPGGLQADGKFLYVLGDATLALFPKPEGTRADHTAISFKVPDIAACIAELQSLLQSDALRFSPGRRFPLAQVAEAHRCVEQGQSVGTVLLGI